ncbi:MAG: hypothetical protein CBB79_01140 [Synechococcus sp. TMED19]|nr:MAG: hypothetical protein CBB79_01140 [Synechococcus sp. TMED19]
MALLAQHDLKPKGRGLLLPLVRIRFVRASTRKVGALELFYDLSTRRTLVLMAFQLVWEHRHMSIARAGLSNG